MYYDKKTEDVIREGLTSAHPKDPGVDFNDPNHFIHLPQEEQSALLSWIKGCVTSPEGRYKPSQPLSSYYLKHRAEQALGFYVSNGALKGAMKAVGHQPVDTFAMPNWEFRVRVLPL